jgi:hypothetical protein
MIWKLLETLLQAILLFASFTFAIWVVAVVTKRMK